MSPTLRSIVPVLCAGLALVPAIWWWSSPGPAEEARPVARLVHEPASKYPLIREVQQAGQQPLRMVADHLVVRLQHGASLQQLQRALEPMGAQVRRVQPLSGLVLVAFDAQGPEALVRMQQRLAAREDLVRYVEPDYLFQATASTPDDDEFPDQWALENTGQDGGTTDADIDAPEAWDITRGRRSSVIGIADSGIDYTHEDLASQMWTNPGEIPGNGIDDDGNGFIDDVYGYDFVDEDGDPFDRDNNNPNARGHGTQQASIAAAATDNGVGVAGVAPDCSLMALRIMFATSRGVEGIRSDAVEALYYAADMRLRGVDIRVTNHSWAGSGGEQQALREAVQANAAAGLMVVAAAGNSGRDLDARDRVPAGLDEPNIIAVAASNRDDQLASFAGSSGSDYGDETVHLAAPGKELRAATLDNSYRSTQGTSPAAPHVAAAVALCFSAAPPDADIATIKQALLDGVDQVPALSGKVITGGRLNVHRSLQLITEAAAGPVVVRQEPVGQITAGALTSLTLGFDRAMAPESFSLADVSDLQGPGGSVAVESGEWIDERTLVLHLPAQRAAGTYSLTIGPHVHPASDPAMGHMDQDRDGTAGEADDVYQAVVSVAGGGPRLQRVVGVVDAEAATVAGIDLLFSEAMDPASFAFADDVLALEDASGRDMRSLVSGTSWHDGDRRLRLSLPDWPRRGRYLIELDDGIRAASDDATLDTGGAATLSREFLVNAIREDEAGYTAYAIDLPDLDLDPADPAVRSISYGDFYGSDPIDLGSHTFNLYGVDYSGAAVHMGQGGILTFERTFSFSEDTGFGVRSLSTLPLQPSIAPLWSDWKSIDFNASTIDSQIQDRDGDGSDDHLVVEWNFRDNGDEVVTFQALLQLDAGTQTSAITFAYPDLDFGSSPLSEGAGAVVGIRGADTDQAPKVLQVANQQADHPLIGSGQALQIGVPASIGGRVFTDDDRDGQLDVAETGLSGRTVYIDTDGDGEQDTHEPQAQTDDAGWYAFPFHPWGSYTVRLVSEVDEDLSAPAGGQHVVAVSDAERSVGWHFAIEGDGEPPLPPSRQIEIVLQPTELAGDHDIRATADPDDREPQATSITGGMRFEDMAPSADHRIDFTPVINVTN